MARLTEREILGRLKESLRLSAEQARRLGNGERGSLYPDFRRNLELVYGCTRQMAGWREDARWLAFGKHVHESRERCRRWIVEKQPGWKFLKLAEALEAALKRALDLETMATGKSGMILPEIFADPSQPQNKPVSMNGLILPPSYSAPADGSVH